MGKKGNAVKRRRAASVRKSAKDTKQRQPNATGDSRDTHKVAMPLLQKSSLSAFNVELGFFNSLYEPRTVTILVALLAFVNLVYLPYFSCCLPAAVNVNVYDKVSKQSTTQTCRSPALHFWRTVAPSFEIA